MARLLAVLALATATVGIGGASPTATSTREGVYTEDQAAAGALLYVARCAMCHGRMLEGTYETPGLQDRFIANWSKAPIADIYGYIARAMPQFAPGSLKPAETARIVAYLLKANGLPAGAKALPDSGPALARIMLEPKAAPISAKAVPKTK